MDINKMEITEQEMKALRREKFRKKYLSLRFVATVLGNIAAYVLVVGIAFIIVYPLLRRIGNAFKPLEEFYDTSIVYFPRNPTTAVIKETLKQLKLDQVLFRSIFLAVFVSAAQIMVAVMVGYGLARFTFKGNKLVFFCVILTLVVPPQAILIPLYLRFRYFDIFGIFKALSQYGEPLKLTDTIIPQLMLAMSGMGLKNGLYIYMVLQYFRGIPTVLEEAAYIDGARTFKTFFRIMLPSAGPMMITVGLFSFSWQWTDVFYSGVFLATKGTIATAVGKIKTTVVDSIIMTMNLQQTAILLILLPLVILFIIMQRFFVEGIERSGIVG